MLIYADEENKDGIEYEEIGAVNCQMTRPAVTMATTSATNTIVPAQVSYQAIIIAYLLFKMVT